MILYLDCTNGISGDRLVAALLDLSGARPGARGPLDKVVRPVLKAAGIDPRLATVEAVRRGRVAALVFRVADAPGFASFDELIMSMYASSVAQPHADIVAAVADRLRAAEHAVHGEGDERRHEPCAVTTAVELIAAAALVHDLGPERIVASPPALGVDRAPSAGGEASASAAVVLQLLHGCPVADERESGESGGAEYADEVAADAAGDGSVADESVDEGAADDDGGALGPGTAAEATTPTGAALLAHFADDFGAPPVGTVAGEGFGAARRGRPGRPDVLRVALIAPAAVGADAELSPDPPSAAAEDSPEASTSLVAADVPAAHVEARADAAHVSAQEAEQPAGEGPVADAEDSPDGPAPSDAAAWFGVTPEPTAESSSAAAMSSDDDAAVDADAAADDDAAVDDDAAADDDAAVDADASVDADAAADAAPDAAPLWGASPLFGAGLAPGALTPDLERTHETDAAPWFAAPLVTLPGTDDDTPRGDEPDAAADPFLTPSGDLPDRTPDADVPGEAEAEAEPEDDDTLAGVKLNDTPNDVAFGAEDDVSADADDEAHDDAVDLDGPDDAGDAPGEAAGDPPDDAEDDQDTLVGGAHADAGRVPGAESEPGAEAVPASALPPTGHVVLETNIDDMSAELLAHAAEALREAGALDVWLTPALMKKGRPGTVLHVLAAANEQERLAGVVFAETTTFGLRVLPVGRLYAEERRETVRIAGHDIGVRLGYAQGRLATVSPEYEDCRGVAAELGRPARVVYEAAQARARSRFSGH